MSQHSIASLLFCPNCGTKVATLETDTWTQTKLYALSLFLPLICFILIGKWRGLHYVRSKDAQKKTIGMIACTLLLLSTVWTIWYTVYVTQKAIDSAMKDVDAALQGY